MTPIKLIFSSTFVLAFVLVMSGCSFFGGDDGELTSLTADTFTPEPTTNVVDPAPAATPTAVAAEPTQAALPTAVPIPATPVPPTPTPDRSQPITYVVQANDVLSLLAEQFDVDIAELRRVNGLSGNLIRVGQNLIIPAIDGSTDSAATDNGASSETAAAATPVPANTPAPVSCPTGSTGHCVQPGDTLLGIASKYGVSVDSLRAANGSIVGDTIVPGQVLNLPGSSTGSTDSTGTTTGTDTTAATPTVDAGPKSDADCAARHPEYPYYHHADGLCYANPVGAAQTPEPDDGAGGDVQCPEGYAEWNDGQCYPLPTPTPIGTPTPYQIEIDYGRPPCDDWEVVIPSTNKCYPKDDATDEQVKAGIVTPTPTPTPTS